MDIALLEREIDVPSESAGIILAALAAAGESARDERLCLLDKHIKTALVALDGVDDEIGKLHEDMKSLSKEMHTLQSQSHKLHHRYQARKAAADALAPLVERELVPPAVVRELSTGEIGPRWKAALRCLIEMNNADSREESVPGADAASQTFLTDARNLRHALLLRTVERAKDYILSRVRKLRRPNVDAQVIQRDLIENQELFTLLMAQAPRVAAGIRQAYVNTMRWYYAMLFGKYGRWLDRQAVFMVDKTKTVGMVANSHKLLFSSATSAKDAEIFNLGARTTLLTSTESALNLTSNTPQGGYHIEVLMRSAFLALRDAAKMESATLDALQISDHQNLLKQLLSTAFKNTLQSAIRWAETYDLFGLLLSMRVLQQLADPCILDVIETVQNFLWKQIKVVFTAHTKSIELTASRPSSQRLQSQTGPHPLTQLTSGLLAGVLQLCPHENALKEPVTVYVRELSAALEMVMTKLSKSSEHQELFLYNNYFMLETLLSDIDGPLAREIANHYKLLVEVYKPRVTNK